MIVEFRFRNNGISGPYMQSYFPVPEWIENLSKFGTMISETFCFICEVFTVLSATMIQKFNATTILSLNILSFGTSVL